MEKGQVKTMGVESSLLSIEFNEDVMLFLGVSVSVADVDVRRRKNRVFPFS